MNSADPFENAKQPSTSNANKMGNGGVGEGRKQRKRKAAKRITMKRRKKAKPNLEEIEWERARCQRKTRGPLLSDDDLLGVCDFIKMKCAKETNLQKKMVGINRRFFDIFENRKKRWIPGIIIEGTTKKLEHRVCCCVRPTYVGNKIVRTDGIKKSWQMNKKPVLFPSVPPPSWILGICSLKICDYFGKRAANFLRLIRPLLDKCTLQLISWQTSLDELFRGLQMANWKNKEMHKNIEMGQMMEQFLAFFANARQLNLEFTCKDAKNLNLMALLFQTNFVRTIPILSINLFLNYWNEGEDKIGIIVGKLVPLLMGWLRAANGKGGNDENKKASIGKRLIIEGKIEGIQNSIIEEFDNDSRQPLEQSVEIFFVQKEGQQDPIQYEGPNPRSNKNGEHLLVESSELDGRKGNSIIWLMQNQQPAEFKKNWKMEKEGSGENEEGQKLANGCLVKIGDIYSSDHPAKWAAPS